jgi:hypothetical protein
MDLSRDRLIPELLNVVPYFIVIIFLVVQTAILKNAFYRVGQEALGMSLRNQGGGGPKKV